MNSYENTIRDSLENMQIEPGDALRNRIMQNAEKGTAPTHTYRRRLSIKAVAIAAVISTLVLATAFTFGDEIVSIIKQVMFGDSVAAQVVYENDNQVSSWGVRNREDLPDAKDYPIGRFDTIEEARLVAPFQIRELTYLPENVVGLDSVVVWRIDDFDPPMHLVYLNYYVELGYFEPNITGNSYLELMQVYAGPDAYFEITNISSVEKVMIGDIEAVLISTPERVVRNNGVTILNEDNMSYSLSWLQDGIAFTLDAHYHEGLTPEIMLMIAKSIS